MPTPILQRPAEVVAILAALVLAGCSGAGDPGTGSGGPAAPETAQERAGYGIGLRLGQNLRQQGVEIDVDQLSQGLRDALEGQEPRIDDAAIEEALTTLQNEASTRRADERAAEAEENRRAGREFLEENAVRDNVATLPSGLQYEVLEEGDGASPDDNDRVTIHYTGTLIDGTEFDSSHQRGQPAIFTLDSVIPGFQEGLQLMQVGSTYKLYVPGEMGYGDNPPAGAIPPGATLIFEVELLQVSTVP